MYELLFISSPNSIYEIYFVHVTKGKYLDWMAKTRKFDRMYQGAG